MNSNNQLKEIDIKNHTLFVININDVDLGNILLDEKTGKHFNLQCFIQNVIWCKAFMYYLL